MNQSLINLIPGPVSVPEEVLRAAHHDFGSPDLDENFLELYNQTEKRLQKILGTENSIIIQTGEGMLGLWGALKSCLKPGDRVVAVCTGVFGYGIADMAEMIGAEVRRLALPYDQTFAASDELEKLVAEFKPLMITAVHCETPSGTLNPLGEIARIKKEYSVPLLCVDTVASTGGCPVEADRNLIDLCLNGSQKWAFETNAAIWATPVIDNGQIYMISQDHSLYALDASSGDPIWTLDIGAASVNSPTARS